MAVRVRIQNFQSIEDQTIVIDGLTAITGTNNSGKTSAMRAIRGVFTNPPAGPLVRIGADHLTVALQFDDGTEVVWEKGWEKPDQKGKTINRYVLNGKVLDLVGRGVPPEVQALGVQEIPAGSDRLWPQIADQFDGNLFLINKSGAIVAEALSDVDRVGKLTSALKASEKDRRAVVAELNVRRTDVETYRERVARYDGLDDVAAQVRPLAEARDALHEARERLSEVRSLRDRWAKTKALVDALAGFDPDLVPDPSSTVRLQKGAQKVRDLRSRWVVASEAVEVLSDFDPDVTIPDPKPALEVKSDLARVRGYADRVRKAGQTASRYVDLDPSLLDTLLSGSSSEAKAAKVAKALQTIAELRDQRGKLVGVVDNLREESTAVDKSRAEAEAEVARLLGDRGVCPTCKTVHKPSKELHL